MKERRAVTVWGNNRKKKSYRCTGGSIWLIVSIENPALSQLCIESERKKHEITAILSKAYLNKKS